MNNISNEDLYRITVDFIKENHLGYGVNVISLCNKLDYPLVKYHNKHKLVSFSKDGFIYREGNNFYIFYNEDMYPNRINFTIAHELGHIVLNHDLVGGKYKNRKILTYGGNDLLEHQANTFAQNILMPADKMVLLKNHSVDDIARYFCVSKKMAEVRLSRLKEDLFYLNKLKEE